MTAIGRKVTKLLEMKRIILFVIIMLAMNSYAENVNDCEVAKLSYLLERAVVHEDKYAFHFALDLGANPNGVGERLAVKCFAGMPTSSPVLTAVNHENIYMLKILLEEGASANAACCDSTALSLAEELGNKEAANLLKEYGAE